MFSQCNLETKNKHFNEFIQKVVFRRAGLFIYGKNDSFKLRLLPKHRD